MGRVLVTGAGGSIDSAICRQVAAQEPARLVLLARGENALFEIDTEGGERLPEELWNGTEDVAPAVQDKLLVIRRPEAEGTSLSRLLGHLSELEALAKAGEIRSLIQELKRVVPEYQPGSEGLAPLPEVGLPDLAVPPVRIPAIVITQSG